MSKTLCDLPLGEEATIVAIIAPPSIKQRFMDMGLIKGSKIVVEKLAPLGSPMQVSIKGFSLCIRKEDASNILIN